MEKVNPTRFLVLVIAGVATAIIAYVVVVRWHYPNIAFRGQFGDSFGGLNTVFSGLAFAGVIATVYLQSKELRIQGEELKQTRIEFQSQNKIISSQLFENTYFNLLDHLGKLNQSISFHNHSTRVDDHGTQALPLLLRSLDEDFGGYQREHKLDNWEKIDMGKVWNVWITNKGLPLNTFLNMVIRVIEYIEEKASIENKPLYYSILKSILNENQTAFVMYDMEFRRGTRLQAICKANHVLSEIRDGNLLHPSHRRIASEYRIAST